MTTQNAAPGFQASQARQTAWGLDVCCDFPGCCSASSPLRFTTLQPKDALAVSVLQVSAFAQRNEYALTEALRARGMIMSEVIAWCDDCVVGHAAVARLSSPDSWGVLLPVAMRTDLDFGDHRADLKRCATVLGHRAGLDLVLSLKSEPVLADAGLEELPFEMGCNIPGLSPKMFSAAPHLTGQDPFRPNGLSRRRAVLPPEFRDV